MGFIRTAQQVALNDLLVAVREANNHYRDAIELLDNKNFNAVLADIAQQRAVFIVRLDAAVRAEDDLPTVPDPDKQVGEMLVHHVSALLKDNYANDIVEQRIDAEKNLANLVVDARTAGVADNHAQLLDDLAAHVAQTIEQLQALHRVVERTEQ